MQLTTIKIWKVKSNRIARKYKQIPLAVHVAITPKAKLIILRLCHRKGEVPVVAMDFKRGDGDWGNQQRQSGRLLGVMTPWQTHGVINFP